MRITSITRDSYVNGPGRRNVLHVQGCTIECPGCFNKHTWHGPGGFEMEPKDVAAELLEGLPQGITISGGEPMEQWDDVKTVIKEALLGRPASDPSMGVIIFTGWTRKQLEKSGRLSEMSTSFHENSSLVSLVVSGPYIEKLACNSPLLSSSNQEIIYTCSAYEILDALGKMGALPRVEVHCDGETATITGFPTEATRQSLMKEL